MSNDRLEDYVDVAERIIAFNEAYPEGSLQTVTWEPREIGGALFVVYQAAAYRTANDQRPGIGTAWEPFPGRTPFTRDSELMNAETAAWGRAIVAVGITASRRLATRQEVQARTGTDPATAPPAAKVGATDAQRRMIHALLAEKQVARAQLAGLLELYQLELKTGWMDELTRGKQGTAGHLIDALAKLPTPAQPEETT